MFIFANAGYGCQGPLECVEINDAYLKANNQTDGVNSYGKMVNLLLAEQRYKLSSTSVGL
ncbi:DUF3810 family protein [Acetobacterium bakii]|uniref:DUF3810 family protein n=1 Tax=Acetobacterium bakii TaxID=52689 RepID=UPI000B3345A8